MSDNIKSEGAGRYSLAELLSVTLIIALLCLALVAVYYLYVGKARQAAALIEGQNVYTAAYAVVSEDIGTGELRYLEPSGEYYILKDDEQTRRSFGLAINVYLSDSTVLKVGVTPVYDDEAADTGGEITSLSLLSPGGSFCEFVYVAHNGYAVIFTDGCWKVSRRL